MSRIGQMLEKNTRVEVKEDVANPKGMLIEFYISGALDWENGKARVFAQSTKAMGLLKQMGSFEAGSGEVIKYMESYYWGWDAAKKGIVRIAQNAPRRKDTNEDNGKPITFQKLNIGDEFMDRISNGSGINSETKMWIEYIKISPSRAKATKQVGYNNERAVGGLYSFSPNSKVYLK